MNKSQVVECPGCQNQQFADPDAILKASSESGAGDMVWCVCGRIFWPFENTGKLKEAK